MDQRLDGAGCGQTKRAHERDDLANILRVIAGEVAREQAAQTHANNADGTAPQPPQFLQPPSQLAEEPRRRSPVDAEVPAEYAIAAAHQKGAKRLGGGVRREKGGCD